MTDEMEPVSAETKRRRKIDDSIARFSAVHDELAVEENKRRERRERLTARPAQLIEQTRTKLTRVVTPSAQHKIPKPKQDQAEDATTTAAPAQRGSSINHGAHSGEGSADEAAEQTGQTRLQEKKKRRYERTLLGGRVSAIVIAALVFLATGTAWGAKTWFNNQFNQIVALDENSTDIKDAAGQSGDQNFLIIGSDTRAGADEEEHVGDQSEAPGARADTIMIAHVPADRQRAVVVSFPRDLEVAQPECQRWDPDSGNYSDEIVPAKEHVKLNSIYAEGGPRCATKMVQQASGMRMNHFVGIDFNGFKNMVDAVGGVTVHTDGPIDDGVLGPIIPDGGDTRVSGDQALNFVRARHVDGDPTSDYGRIKRQQEFLSSLLNEVMSNNVLFDMKKLSGFVNAFAAASFGENLGVDQMLTLAQSMQGLNTGKIDFLTVPTTGESNSRGNEVLIESKTTALFRSLIDNAPLPETSPEAEEARPAE